MHLNGLFELIYMPIDLSIKAVKWIIKKIKKSEKDNIGDKKNG